MTFMGMAATRSGDLGQELNAAHHAHDVLLQELHMYMRSGHKDWPCNIYLDVLEAVWQGLQLIIESIPLLCNLCVQLPKVPGKHKALQPV